MNARGGNVVRCYNTIGGACSSEVQRASRLDAHLTHAIHRASALHGTHGYTLSALLPAPAFRPPAARHARTTEPAGLPDPTNVAVTSAVPDVTTMMAADAGAGSVYGATETSPTEVGGSSVRSRLNSGTGVGYIREWLSTASPVSTCGWPEEYVSIATSVATSFHLGVRPARTTLSLRGRSGGGGEGGGMAVSRCSRCEGRGAGRGCLRACPLCARVGGARSHGKLQTCFRQGCRACAHAQRTTRSSC